MTPARPGPLHWNILSVTLRGLLSLLAIIFLAGCTGIFSNVFGQDKPELFAPSPPLYRLPLPAGRSHFLLMQGVGGKFSHQREQTWSFDWSMPKRTPVPAARGGVVTTVRSEPDDRSLPFESRMANFVRIRHEDGTIGVYAHLDSAAVVVGQMVDAGEIIGLSGNTGYSTQPHLHFHVERNGYSIPISFVDVDDPMGIPRVGKLYRGQ